MSNDAEQCCFDFVNNEPSDCHNFIVVDWAYLGGAPNVHPHTKQARRLLCQNCFVQYDLGMIERARNRLLNIE